MFASEFTRNPKQWIHESYSRARGTSKDNGSYHWCTIEGSKLSRGLVLERIWGSKITLTNVEQGRREPRVHQGLVGPHQKGQSWSV